jgi:hypothetical protein
MKSNGLRILHDSEGKGVFGCMVLLVVFIAAVFIIVKLAPLYYSNYSLEAEVKTEISRAGAHSLTDETVIRDILNLAKRNEIQLKQENISIQRYAGQIHVEVNYSIPVDFLILERDINFKIKESSFIGSL